VSDIFRRPVEFPGDRKNIKFMPQTRYPEFRRIINNPKFVAGLKQVFGEDFLMYPEESIHDSGLLGGWHKDTGRQESEGYEFHWEPGFDVATIGLYLQENHEEYAGGLDVVPGSHRVRSTVWQNMKSSNTYVKYVLHHLDKRNLLPKSIVHGRKGAVSIRHKLGDVVVFNMLLDHRPTHPTKMPVPEEFRKYACFLKCGVNNALAKRYLDFIKTRSDYVYLREFHYPQEFLEVARQSGVNLVY
jgi:hypothetical protein